MEKQTILEFFTNTKKHYDRAFITYYNGKKIMRVIFVPKPTKDSIDIRLHGHNHFTKKIVKDIIFINIQTEERKEKEDGIKSFNWETQRIWPNSKTNG